MRKSLLIISLLVSIPALLLASNAFAKKGGNRNGHNITIQLYGMANSSCAKANELMDTVKDFDLLWTSFISGYFSATNIWVAYITEQEGIRSDVFVDGLNGEDLEKVVQRVIAYCKNHPQDSGNTAIQMVTKPRS